MTPDSANQAPASVAFPKNIKSFVKRAGRTTTGQAKAFEVWGPQFLLTYAPETLNMVKAFGLNGQDAATGPVILEIGFGMGEATAHIAKVRPSDFFLCCEVHEPGVGALLKRIGEQDIQNIRILQHDAVEVIDNMLPVASLDGVHIFFPDPWHKSRHNKRRLIQTPLIAKLAARLKLVPTFIAPPIGNLMQCKFWKCSVQSLCCTTRRPMIKGVMPSSQTTAH